MHNTPHSTLRVHSAHIHILCTHLTEGSSCEDGEGVKLVSGEVSDCADDISEKAQQIMEVEHLQGYLACLQQIMDLRCVHQRREEGQWNSLIRTHFEQVSRSL